MCYQTLFSILYSLFRKRHCRFAFRLISLSLLSGGGLACACVWEGGLDFGGADARMRVHRMYLKGIQKIAVARQQASKQACQQPKRSCVVWLTDDKGRRRLTALETITSETRSEIYEYIMYVRSISIER